MTTPSVRDLPDFPGIRKLASALFRLDARHHGAAIMIGAGFSRSAARHVGGERKMPLWGQFTKRLESELNVNGTDLTFSDPLRVAEEYRAYFGQAALNDRIRHEIADDSWLTGPLHQQLLELPWSEVLTTNWDTLLERAANNVHSPYYTVVTKTSDLAWAQTPRIAKLHGTIGVTESFIAAQEDYRTYPERFAPFVNFARQVFIENEFCLLGFSGDDPNFVQWTGWVRDHLANHARRIYLVGALNLSAARRKHLESVNIAPIDLWPIVAHITDTDLRHQRAVELFLEALKTEASSTTKPHEWEPTNLVKSSMSAEDHTRAITDPEYGAKLLSEQIATLKRDREAYPGWLVCPPSLRWSLAHQISHPLPSMKNLAALDEGDRAKLLYEISWRHSVTFHDVRPWLADELFKFANPDFSCALTRRQQLEISLFLLNNARWIECDSGDERRVGDQRVLALIDSLKKYAAYLPDCAAELAYHRAIVARDSLDYDGIASSIEGIVGENPVWKLRQASMLMELARFEEASQILAQCYGELREAHRRERSSIPILSRLMWTHWLLEAAQHGRLRSKDVELPASAENTYRRLKCDPWTWLDNIRESTVKQWEDYLERQKSIEPLFGQGHYRDHSGNRSASADTSIAILLDGLSKQIGIPLRLRGASVTVNLLASNAERIVLSADPDRDLQTFILAIRAASSEDSTPIKSAFSRIGVARASQDVVDTLVARLLAAISYWRNERLKGASDSQKEAISMLRVFLEVLARLAVRVSSECAKQLYLLGVSLGQQAEFQHFWLSESLENLLTHALTSIRSSQQGELLPSALAFPLACEVATERFPHWPNPVIEYLHDRSAYSGIGDRIAQLIEVVATGRPDARSEALLRLLPLSKESSFLVSSEHEKLASAIWGNPPNYLTLPSTGLFAHALLMLPCMDKERAEQLVRAYLFDDSGDVLENTQKELRVHPSPEIQSAVQTYDGIANAAANERTALFPTAAQAQILFDCLISWRPVEDTDGWFRDRRQRLKDPVGRALANGIVPALAPKTLRQFEQIHDFHLQIQHNYAVLPAFVYFAHIDDSTAKVTEKIIRKALWSNRSDSVSYAALALRRWMHLPDSTGSAEFTKLVSTVVAIIESGRTVGLHQLIWLAEELLTRQCLSDDQIKALIEAVPTAFESASYINIDYASQEAVNASTIRAALVKLAHTLTLLHPHAQALEDVLAKSRVDPLPEVRFALDTTAA
ncbi:SIR2 family protein [Cupriavidus sp. YR651]|uniref:SIR2 family protein n=1 Tax=Cupriavidus sp. YR651 TaxID=1855315 RepID=UPI000B8362A2|nr:SIR2 family protein [Cupriavidus sp. YR651]